MILAVVMILVPWVVWYCGDHSYDSRYDEYHHDSYEDDESSSVSTPVSRESNDIVSWW